jgi:hypothetical protein
MKKILSIVTLASFFVVLFTTSGITLYDHYCYHAHSGSISISPCASNCGSCLESTGCQESIPASTTLAEKCCTNKALLFRLAFDYEKSVKAFTFRSYYQQSPDEYLPQLASESTTHPLCTLADTGPPGLSGRDLILFIHQPKIPLPSIS